MLFRFNFILTSIAKSLEKKRRNDRSFKIDRSLLVLFLIHLERFSDDLQAYELSSHFHRHHPVLIENVVALFRSNQIKKASFGKKKIVDRIYFSF